MRQIRLLLFAFTTSILITSHASAQSDNSSESFDLAGMWAALVLEDWYDRVPGGGLGDYIGIPINEAALQKAQTWDASILSQPERQGQPHPAQYSFRGPRPDLRFEQVIEPSTGRLIAYRTNGTFGRADRTIWLDGRPHPDERYGLHTWNGFSTGEWNNGVLIVTTTHMKYGVYQRNGVPASPYGRMTEYFFRHGNYLSMLSYIEDPIYLEEPFVRSQTWVWNPPQNVGSPRPNEAVEEVDMGRGWVPHWPLGTVHPELAERLGVSLEATQGGAITLYPEYRETLRRMREEFDDNAERGQQ